MRASRGLACCLLLSLIGIGLSGYLTYLHLGLIRGELLGGPACGSGVFNCYAVTAGKWGSFLGMPLSLWGVLGYLMIAALALLGRQPGDWADHTTTLIFLLALVFLLLDAGLFYLMAVVIRYYCPICLVTYGLNLLLLITAWRSLGRPWPTALGRAGAAVAALMPSGQRPAAWLFWGVVGAGILASVGVHGATMFLTQGSPGTLRVQLREYVSRQARVHVDVSDDPRAGPASAPVQIVEFSDFLCPACQRAFKLNAIVLANHRQDVAFIFKNFPLDTTCNAKIARLMHPGACNVAAASECANAQGQFWRFHDRVFELAERFRPSELEEEVGKLGLDVPRFHACLESGQGMESVKRDIEEAAKVGVRSTPTYVINGLPMEGGLNPAMFDEFLSVLQEGSR